MTRFAAASQVLLSRDRLQVIGIDATRVAAQMVDLEPFGDRAAQELPCDSMRSRVFAVTPDVAISGADLVGRPQPARRGLFDVCPEPGIDGMGRSVLLRGQFAQCGDSFGAVVRVGPQFAHPRAEGVLRAWSSVSGGGRPADLLTALGVLLNGTLTKALDRAVTALRRSRPERLAAVRAGVFGHHKDYNVIADAVTL